MTSRSDLAIKQRAAVRRFQSSGLTQAEFSRREGISRVTLLRWIKRASAQPTHHGASPEFLPLVVLQGENGLGTESLSQTTVLAEVLLKGGKCLRIKAGAELADLVTLIKALEQC